MCMRLRVLLLLCSCLTQVLVLRLARRSLRYHPDMNVSNKTRYADADENSYRSSSRLSASDSSGCADLKMAPINRRP